MKGLKKVALVSAIAAVSAGAQAELKALDDSAMGELTGQAGITIDLETKSTIGEFAYQDYNETTGTGGFLVVQDIAFGANSNETNTYGSSSLVDNIRIDIDVANGAEGFNFGLASFGVAASQAISAYSNTDAAAIVAQVGTGENVDGALVAGDGDLVIHIGPTDAFQKGGGAAAYLANTGTNYNGTNVGGAGIGSSSWSDIVEVITHAVDLQLDIGVVGLASSTKAIGGDAIEHGAGLATDSDASNTALISDLSIKGFGGPRDIHIENAGNNFRTTESATNTAAFATTLSAGYDVFSTTEKVGEAESRISLSTYGKITDLDVYIDIAGVQINDLSVQNNRGDITGVFGTDAFGFSHSVKQIFAVKDAVKQVSGSVVAGLGSVVATDGIGINSRMKADIDIGAISFGDTGTSIGKIYITDLDSTRNIIISAH